MVKSILTVIGLILCIWGLSELIHNISLYTSCPKHRHKSCSVIWLDKDSAFKQLRYARLQMRWLGAAYADMIIAVTDGMPREDIALLCECFRDGFVFCPSDAIADVTGSITGENYADGRFDESPADRGNSGCC